MQPAVVPLQIVAGDSLTLTIRLHTTDGGNRLPLQLAAGEAFVVSLDWAKGRIVSTTSDAFDTGTIAGGQSVELVIDQAGTYTYFCWFHGGMTGTITVTE